jgi:hypothetical protein
MTYGTCLLNSERVGFSASRGDVRLRMSASVRATAARAQASQRLIIELPRMEFHTAHIDRQTPAGQ